MAAAAAAALAAADPPPAMPQAAGAGGPTARRDFYWLRSFLAGGIAGCCAKTTVAPLDRVKVLLQAHNRHYKHFVNYYEAGNFGSCAQINGWIYGRYDSSYLYLPS